MDNDFLDFNPIERPKQATTKSNMETYSYSSESDDDNDPIKKINRRKLNDQKDKYNPRNPKFSIWSNAIQEDCLMENLKGCDVANNRKRGRDVENYDFSLKYKMNGESSNMFKRRKSNSTEDYDSDQRNTQHRKKRKQRRYNHNNNFKKSHYDDSSNDERQMVPRIILDLTATVDSSNEDFARDMSNKLFEDKDDLLVRIVEVLGKEIPMAIFKETQKIELEGGMMILNGNRRRTPGGVFLFLLKKSDNVSKDDLRLIFQEDKTKTIKERKDLQQATREMKVEELKKSLNMNGNELNIVPKIDAGLLKPESLSNPPPSPETDTCREINTNTEKIVNVASSASYEDDFLDIHAEDMEIF